MCRTETLCVTTQRRLERHEVGGLWLRLSDFGDITEFFTACSRLFPEEPNPQFRFIEWTDIPDGLIRVDWLSPNLFDVLDALSYLDEDDRAEFLLWCRNNGYDMATDDAAELTSRYRSLYDSYVVPEEEPPETNDAAYVVEIYLPDTRRYHTELFDDNYD